MSQHAHEPEHEPEHAHEHAHAPGEDRPDAFDADYLELEARLSADATEIALDRVEAALGEEPTQIVELGSGSGADAIALAQRFPAARVHALDVSSELLTRVEANAVAAGVSDRVTVHLLDLDTNWSAEVPANIDIAWASLSLHHVNDPALVLRQVFESLRPGGTLVLTEMTGKEGYQPDDLGSASPDLRRGLEQARLHHEHMSGIDWPTLLTEVGFAALESQEYDFVARADTADGARYLERRLDSERGRLTDELTDEGLTGLDAATRGLGEGTSKISFTSGRVTWLATRP